MIGSPFAGDRMLFDDIISARASSCASSDSGTCTAIWSPSKSALNAVQTSGCSWIALPSISTGSNAWMPRRCSVGARFSSTGCSRITSSRMSHTSALSRSTSFLAALIVVAKPRRCSLREDERLEELERHLLRQAALVQLQRRTDHDDRTARVVDALAEQVLAETALLALDHVGERLQRALVGARDRAAATAVVHQRVDGFLKHALLVAHDDVGRIELEQPLQSVVAVDDAAIEIVQIRRREATAIERHQRTQVRRQHRQHGQHHVFRTIARFEERLDELDALGKTLQLRLGIRRRDFLAQANQFLIEIDRLEQLIDRFGAHARVELVAVLFDRRQILLFVEQLAALERGQTRIDDDIGFEIEDALDIAQRHVEHQTDARRQRLQEPDVRGRARELDVAHALAAHLGQRHFRAALFADDAAVLHALVLAAQALVVLDRSEDGRAEQAVTLGLERAVVDRFGLLHLAERPRADQIRRSQRDLDRIEIERLALLVEEVEQVFHFVSPYGVILEERDSDLGFRIADRRRLLGPNPDGESRLTSSLPVPY